MRTPFLSELSLALVCPPSLFDYNGKFSDPTYKIYRLRLPSPKPKNLGFSSRNRPKRLIYYSNTVWPRYLLDNRSQWPEKGTLTIDNFLPLLWQVVRDPLCSGFLCFPLLAFSLYFLFYFSNIFSPFWATAP